jgi:hypothetical protein
MEPSPLPVVPLANVEVVSRGTALKRVVQTRHTSVYNISGLPIYEMNTALEKHFPVHKTLSASFRAEALNLLNHEIVNAPPANISTPRLARSPVQQSAEAAVNVPSGVLKTKRGMRCDTENTHG